MNEDCLQYFHKFEYICEYKVKFVRREERNFSTISTKNKMQIEPIDEQNDLHSSPNVYQQVERGLSFDSVTKITVKVLRIHEIQASKYCFVPKPYCDYESIVNKQNTDDNYCFSWCILAHLHKMILIENEYHIIKLISLNLI